MNKKPTFLKSFVVTGLILISSSYLLHCLTYFTDSATFFSSRWYFLSHIDEVFALGTNFDFCDVVGRNFKAYNNMGLNDYLFWIPGHTIIFLIIWPTVQKAIFQELHQRWIVSLREK
tara:strand:+ start:156 stop:506 length:351 start_codon:yes stop_codon:yes gene_type:complete